MISSIALNAVVYNEEHRIWTFLNELPFVDEIVIVDQSSTDSTVEAIYDYMNDFGIHINVITDQHWGYCEPSRKLAWKNTKSEWILVLDADERVSDEFVNEMHTLDNITRNVKLKRSFWLGGEHRFTGDYQHRFFHRDCVQFLDELHTEPQPVGFYPWEIYSPDYVGIWHEKSWQEQLRDEQAYEQIINATESGESKGRKLALNVHLELARQTGFTAEQIDAMTIEQRKEVGVGVC